MTPKVVMMHPDIPDDKRIIAFDEDGVICSFCDGRMDFEDLQHLDEPTSGCHRCGAYFVMNRLEPTTKIAQINNLSI